VILAAARFINNPTIMQPSEKPHISRRMQAYYSEQASDGKTPYVSSSEEAPKPETEPSSKREEEAIEDPSARDADKAVDGSESRLSGVADGSKVTAPEADKTEAPPAPPEAVAVDDGAGDGEGEVQPVDPEPPPVSSPDASVPPGTPPQSRMRLGEIQDSYEGSGTFNNAIITEEEKRNLSPEQAKAEAKEAKKRQKAEDKARKEREKQEKQAQKAANQPGQNQQIPLQSQPGRLRRMVGKIPGLRRFGRSQNARPLAAASANEAVALGGGVTAQIMSEGMPETRGPNSQERLTDGPGISFDAGSETGAPPTSVGPSGDDISGPDVPSPSPDTVASHAAPDGDGSLAQDAASGVPEALSDATASGVKAYAYDREVADDKKEDEVRLQAAIAEINADRIPPSKDAPTENLAAEVPAGDIEEDRLTNVPVSELTGIRPSAVQTSVENGIDVLGSSAPSSLENSGPSPVSLRNAAQRRGEQNRFNNVVDSGMAAARLASGFDPDNGEQDEGTPHEPTTLAAD